jgi:hypothetical protein
MQAHLCLCEPKDLSHGLVAYAERQAAVYEEIAGGHALHWLPILKSFHIKPCWGPRYATWASVAPSCDIRAEGSDSGTEYEEVGVDSDT